MRAFEDFTVGLVIEHASQTVSRDDIVAFAQEFDPQAFHLDENALATRFTGGLIASGWHVAAIYMRMMADSFLLNSTCLGSPGVETLKWAKPVRPGDTLSGRSTVTAARASGSRPDRGIVTFRHDLDNQAGDTVMWMINPVLFLRRAP